MYNTLKRLYAKGKIDKAGLSEAVTKGWITEDQYKTITGEALEG